MGNIVLVGRDGNGDGFSRRGMDGSAGPEC
jgi:hypothetical protein